jgi:hypothetical protein
MSVATNYLKTSNQMGWAYFAAFVEDSLVSKVIIEV